MILDSWSTRGQYRGVAVDLRGVTAVLLPGTGSDDDYVHRAFSGPLQGVGAVLVTPPPAAASVDRRLPVPRWTTPRAQVRSVSAVSRSAPRSRPRGRWRIPITPSPCWPHCRPGPGHPDRRPPLWRRGIRRPSCARDGLAATTAQMRASSPPWLAEELTRSWRGAVAAIARRHGGSGGLRRTELRRAGPAGRAAGRGRRGRRSDSPAAGRCRLGGAAPHAALRTVTLDQIGADTAALGAACLAALADLTCLDRLAAGVVRAQLLHGRSLGAAAGGRLVGRLLRARLAAAACWAAASRSCSAIGSGSCTGNGVRTGSGVSPRRTTVSANAVRAS